MGDRNEVAVSGEGAVLFHWITEKAAPGCGWGAERTEARSAEDPVGRAPLDTAGCTATELESYGGRGVTDIWESV